MLFRTFSLKMVWIKKEGIEKMSLLENCRKPDGGKIFLWNYKIEMLRWRNKMLRWEHFY